MPPSAIRRAKKPSFEALAIPPKGHYPAFMRRTLLIGLLLAALASSFASGALAARDGVAAPEAWKSRLAELPAASRVAVVGSGPLVWKSVAVRTEPSRTAPVIQSMKQFRKDFRPQFVLAREQRLDPRSGEAAWYRITVPGRPNGRTGWIPAAAASLKPVDRWLVVHRSTRRFEFYVEGRAVRTGVVAVGAPGMETPTGLFYIQWKFDPTWAVLGAFAFETSGYSKLSDWPGGGVVGVHGTNAPQLLGRAVSHGCVRMANEDILALRSLMKVGTPVKIVA